MHLKAQGLDDYVCKHFGIDAPEADMTQWQILIDTVRNLEGEVSIALVRRNLLSLPDAYLSVVEALKHAGYHFGKKVKIKWIDSEKVTENTVEELFSDVDGILVPGGFGNRGVEGKILSCQYARAKTIFLILEFV